MLRPLLWWHHRGSLRCSPSLRLRTLCLPHAAPLHCSALLRLAAPPAPPAPTTADPPAGDSPASRLPGAPSSDAASRAEGSGGSSTRRILTTLLHYTWPAGQPALRARVVASIALLVCGKLINIQVPFLFKHIVDTLSVAPASAAAALPEALAAADAVLGAATGVPLAATLPVSLLLGYGLARTTSAGFNELRNTIFASVAQRAIRLVSRDVFR